MIKRIVRFLLPLVLLSLACSTLPQVARSPVEPNLTPSSAAPAITETHTLTPPAPSLEPSPTAPTLTPTSAFVCKNTLPTRLKVGAKGQVTINKGAPTRLRRDPVVSDSNIIKLLADGAQFETLDGPVCTIVPDTGQAFIFWQVRTLDDSTKGWVAEADAASYFIEPIP